MLRRYFVTTLLFLTFIPLSANALPEPNVVTLDNVADVPQAVAEISNTLESQGFDIVLSLDHAANAARVGLDLEPTTVIFARLPKNSEKAILRKGDTIGIDLPLKFLVFEQDDEILLATNAIGYLTDRHTLITRDSLLNGLDKVQDQFGEPDDGLITIQSTRSVQDTALALQDVINEIPAFGIPLVLDYGDRKVKSAGPVLIVFGNPNVGTPLMQAQRTIGIDLPQKFLVWEDRSGNTNITYNDPFALADRHSIENQDERLTAVSNALANFANAGAGL